MKNEIRVDDTGDGVVYIFFTFSQEEGRRVENLCALDETPSRVLETTPEHKKCFRMGFLPSRIRKVQAGYVAEYRRHFTPRKVVWYHLLVTIMFEGDPGHDPETLDFFDLPEEFRQVDCTEYDLRGRDGTRPQIIDRESHLTGICPKCGKEVLVSTDHSFTECGCGVRVCNECQEVRTGEPCGTCGQGCYCKECMPL